MSETTQSEQLEKRQPDAPEPDPIADRSLSGPLLFCSILLVVSLVWALYDEVLGQRPWKGFQKDFVSRYSEYLNKATVRQRDLEQKVKESSDYEKLNDAFEAAAAEAKTKTEPIDAEVKKIDEKLTDVTPPFQDARSYIVARTYKL